MTLSLMISKKWVQKDTVFISGLKIIILKIDFDLFAANKNTTFLV